MKHWLGNLFTISMTIAVIVAGSSPVNGALPPTKAVLVLSTAGTASKIGGVNVTVMLPAGVTVQADANGVSPASLTASGQGTGSLILGNYKPATATSPGTVNIVLASLSGINAGEFARLTCDVLDGNSPNLLSFPASAISIVDVNSLPLPNATVFISLLDTIPPTFAASTLSDGAKTNNATLNIYGSGTDNTGIESVTVNGQSVSLNIKSNPDGSVNYDFTYSFTLSSGLNTITIIATDLAGNIQVDAGNNPAPDVRTITLDQTAPVIRVTAPADNSKTRVSPILVAGTVGEQVQKIDVTVGNGTPQSATVSGNSFTATIDLAPGTNTIWITATGLAGNTSSVKRTVILNNQVPTLAITDPNQDIITARNPIRIRGSSADNLTNAAVTVSAGGTTYTPQEAADGSFVQSVAFNGANLYQVTVISTDEGGNSTSVRRNIRYSPPDVNDDKDVDIADALLALKIAVKLEIPTTDQVKRGDVAPLVNKAHSDDLNMDIGVSSPDGIIDISDALLILNYCVKLVTW